MSIKNRARSLCSTQLLTVQSWLPTDQSWLPTALARLSSQLSPSLQSVSGSAERTMEREKQGPLTASRNRWSKIFRPVTLAEIVAPPHPLKGVTASATAPKRSMV